MKSTTLLADVALLILSAAAPGLDIGGSGYGAASADPPTISFD